MGEKKQFGFYLNSSTCIGCKTCLIACKDKNDLPVEVNWRRSIEYCGGSWQGEKHMKVPDNVFVYYLTLSCQHCENPLCLINCPVTAISKDDNGIVHVDQEICIGCQTCASVCPYDAPQFGGDSDKMSKCDMCFDLITVGENPVCVDACPLRALDWGEMEDLRKKYGNIDAVDPLPDGNLTNPSLVITPHRHTQALSGGAGHSAMLPESNPESDSAIGPNISY
jgi:anaerobic dimethyl sulfoxide reductase subunit B